MKKLFTTLGLVCLTAFTGNFLHAQQLSSPSISTIASAATDYVIVNADANSRVWQKIVQTTDAQGNITYQTNRAYVELASGLNHLVGNQWVASKEEINIAADGNSALATNGQHQAYFPGDIYNGKIELVTPDGKQLYSRPMGLSYDDGTKTVLIAELTNATGEVLPVGNQVVYANAFTGLKADIRYTYTKAGFEQDIILREQPPSPASFGLNSDTTKLQVLTEFFNPPQPTVTATTVPTDAGNLENDNLSFGMMQMGQGRAFLLGTNTASVIVNKQWLALNGRQMLVEEVPVPSIADELSQLPTPQTTSIQPHSPLNVVSAKRLLPAQHLAAVPSRHLMRIAKAASASNGLVLDYVTLNFSTNTYTFQGDTTYYISGAFDLSGTGTNTFEGGAVIKYARNALMWLVLSEMTLNWQASAYRPVIFTAVDDNSVGETITNSTGNPTNYYAKPALMFSSGGGIPTNTLQYARIAYAQYGIEPSYAPLVIRDSQFVNVANPIKATSSSVTLENVLMYNVSGTALWLYGSGGNCVAENLTVHNAATFLYLNGPSLYMTNSLFICVTNWGGTFTGAFNATNSSDSGVFQTFGNGDHYLSPDSPYIDAGNTTADRLGLYSYTTQTNQTIEGISTVDLGYHYPAVDASNNPVSTLVSGVPDYISDSNGDGLPDAWESNYFGNLNQFASGLDPNGNTFLYDYQNGLDPDVITFTLSVTNFEVNQTIVPVQINLSGGTPSYYAVLVNDTNTADADWQTYTGTNLLVNLGSADGVYAVWVGLKGLATNATVTWDTSDLSLTLDRTPPVLVITNPVSTAVAQPMIELQGYSPEALSSISYDLTNALGLVTNQQVLISDQFYDTNVWKFTTNTFQGYDIPLTNGLNTITLHATDLAGNSTTTNFNFTLDYSGKTNPPTVQFYWPTNGTQIAGTNFTWRGWVSDFTATVAVQMVDTNGYTNIFNGMVERNGNFWLENLPLNSGTNDFTLTVTDAAGNVATTNLNVVGNDLVITINESSGDAQLWQTTINLTGTISDATYAVWVNGVKGHNNGDGTWLANNVPVNQGGTASFVVTAYAPDEQQPDGSYGN